MPGTFVFGKGVLNSRNKGSWCEICVKVTEHAAPPNSRAHPARRPPVSQGSQGEHRRHLVARLGLAVPPRQAARECGVGVPIAHRHVRPPGSGEW